MTAHQFDIPIPPKGATATEAEMEQRIIQKFSETRGGNGDAYAVVTQVRNAAGFNATRTADAIVMGLWPSRGLVLQGFEIKVSRADWLRELKRPEKAEVFCDLVDFWWVVVSDKSIVQDGELPPGWGLMVPHGKGLKVAVQALQLREDRPPISRSFLACLMRSAAKQQKSTPYEIRTALAKQEEEHSARVKGLTDYHEEREKKLRDRIRAFEREAGVSLEDTWSGNGRDAKETGRLVKLVISGEADVRHSEQRLRSLARQARELAEHIEAKLPEEVSDDVHQVRG